MEPLDLHERTYGSSPISFDTVINKTTETEAHVYDVFSLALQYCIICCGQSRGGGRVSILNTIVSTTECKIPR